MNDSNGEEKVAKVLTEMPKPPLKRRILSRIAEIGAVIALLGVIWFLCCSKAAEKIVGFVSGGNGYFVWFIVLLGFGCAIITAGEAKEGKHGSLIFVPFACAGCVIGALQVNGSALLFIAIASIIGTAWVVSNIRIANYYKRAIEDYNRVQYELEQYKKNYRDLARTIETREK